MYGIIRHVLMIMLLYTYFNKRCRRERRISVVERRLHDRKELWFPYLVCKNNDYFAWRKTAVRTANWPRLNMTVHEKFRNIAFHCPFTNAQEKRRLCRMTRHRRSALYGACIKEDYFLLIFNTHISF